jgi:hypothetical protein
MHSEQSKFREGEEDFLCFVFEEDFLLPPQQKYKFRSGEPNEGANLHKKASRFFYRTQQTDKKQAQIEIQTARTIHLPRGKARTRIQSLQCKFEKKK